MLDTDNAWRRWGRADPYFGVLADERFSRLNIHRTRNEFLTSGEQFISQLMRRYELHFGDLRRVRALDHGCGVGRLTLPLSAHFSELVAVDVSDEMLAEARSNAFQTGVANTHFALADDELTNAPGEFDFVNSHLVLQHVPVHRGLPILFRLIDKVRPGGGFHVHFSCRTESLSKALLYWASANVPGVKVWQNLCAGRRWNAPAMQMNNYPFNRILARLAGDGITDLLVTIEHHPRFVSCSLLGRRPC